MSTKLVPKAYEPGTGDDDLAHLVCCEDNVGAKAFCGTDVSNSPWGNGPEETDCIVCQSLSDSGWCPRYGRCE